MAGAGGLAVDAVMVLSFGGPEGPEDVLPFLRNVTAGRNVPDDRLAEVAEQYALFGGRSPINDQNRRLISALSDELSAHGHDLPVYFGNRNWEPFVTDTVATMADDGVRRAAVFVTSAFGSYSGCRQYREDLARSTEALGDRAPVLEKLRLYYNHPGFLDPLARHVGQAAAERQSAHVVFTAHSIPNSMAAGCDYERQLAEAAAVIMDRAGHPDRAHTVAYQSRSGPPSIPWLEPDINDHLAELARSGADDVIVVPLGFVSDHMEVLFDLDVQAAKTASDLGLGYLRLPTVGVDPDFVSMIRLLLEERYGHGSDPRLALGPSPAWPDSCPEGHCPAPTRTRTR